MGWSDWPYWLKGGVILGILEVIFLFWIFSQHPDTRILLNTYFTFSQFHESNPILQNVLILITGFIIYFVIGAIICTIIGWLYGKYKNRNSAENVSQ